MEKVRIGNDIQVKYTVLRDGQPESFVGATNIVVTVKNEAYGKIVPSTFSILNNIVTISLDAADCVLCGKHRVTLSYNRGNDITIDALAFELVQFTSLTGGTEIVGVEIVTVNISGDIGIAIPDNNKIDFDGLNSNVKRLQFDTVNPVAGSQAGQVFWSNEEKTLVLNDGYHTHPIGKELGPLVKNNSGQTIINGQACYVIGSTGDNPTIGLASVTNGDVAQKTIGLATMDIPNNGFGIVTTFGEVNDVNTSTLTQGAIIYLGVNGALTTTEPVAPTAKIIVGICVRQHATVGKIFVATKPIPRLSKLSDVYTSTLNEGDVLRWNGTTLRYEAYSLTNKADLVGGKIPTSQLPSYVDDVLEYTNLAAFPATGETGKIYVALDTNLTYRWSGAAYIEISKSLALGEASSTAYRGDRGKTAYDHSQASGNPHGTTASQIPNAPAGTVVSTTVQGAINELASDIVQVETEVSEAAKLSFKYNILPYISDTSDKNCLFLTGNSWQPVANFNLGTSIINNVLTYANVSANKTWFLAGAVISGVSNLIRIKAKGSVSGCKLFIGSSFSSEISASNAQITLTTDYAYYDVSITAGSTDLYITLIGAKQPSLPVTIEVAEVYPNIYKKTDLDYSKFETDLNNIKSDVLIVKGDSVISGSDSTMSGANNWVAALGGLSFNVNTTIAGKMFLNFTSGRNQAIKLTNKLIVGHKYRISVKARLNSGAGNMNLSIGSFFASVPGTHSIFFKPTSVETEFTGEITAQTADVWLGGMLADNNGSDFEIDDILFYDTTSQSIRQLDERVTVLESIPTVKSSPISFNTEHFLSSLSRYDKPLTKLFVNGDSLMANAIGGVVPNFEGEGAFPLMLSVNNIARRIYDLVSWNKPIWRNLFHIDWTKSGWTDDKANVLNRAHSLEHYYLSVNGATASITIPENYENFAILCRKSTTAGSLNITINGAAVAVGNPNPTLTAAFNNSFHVEEYLGISPTGDKTLQIESVGVNHVWGIMYWSGNTLMVTNIARGGHDLGMLKTYWNAEFIQNSPDALIFEIPELNQLRGTLSAGLTDLEYFVDQLKFKDHCFMSCNALGTDPSDGTPNFWASYLDPNQRDFNDAFRNLLFKAGEPFIDVFHAFELKVINRGGTFEDGDCGLWYTHDGQHGSEAGQREWWNIIRYVFENKPIRYS